MTASFCVSTVRLDPSLYLLAPLLDSSRVIPGISLPSPSTTRDIDGCIVLFPMIQSPMDRLAYGVMMNGRSNSSAAGLVAVRVPEDEKSWYGVSGVTPIIIVIVMSLCSTRLEVLNYDPSTWRAGVTLIRV